MLLVTGHLHLPETSLPHNARSRQTVAYHLGKERTCTQLDRSGAFAGHLGCRTSGICRAVQNPPTYPRLGVMHLGGLVLLVSGAHHLSPSGDSLKAALFSQGLQSPLSPSHPATQ